MKFSTEAIVALAVAVVFVLLSVGVIAREQGQGPARGMHNVRDSAWGSHETGERVHRATTLI